MFYTAKNGTEQELRALLAQARQAALSSLQQYDLAWTQIHFIQQSDTITFRIETETTDRYLLRVHTNGMSRDQIHSELVFLNAISESAVVTVPTGVAASGGTYVQEYATIHGDRLYVTLMRWVDGEQPTNGLTDQQVTNLGIMMAYLHQAASDFVPQSDYVRPTWGIDSFTQEMAKLERFYDRFLSVNAWGNYQAAAEIIQAKLASMSREASNYGFIHADLHIGNVVFQGDEPYPIDFGRCGFGYYHYDLACMMVGLSLSETIITPGV